MPYLHGFGGKKVVAKAKSHLEVENDLVWYAAKNKMPVPEEGDPKEVYLTKILDLVKFLEAKISTLEEAQKQ